MNKKKLLLWTHLVTCCILLSCGTDSPSAPILSTAAVQTEKIKSWMSESNKLVYILYQPIKDSTVAFDPKGVLYKDSIHDFSQIKLLNTAISKSINGGYCWPMNHHYSIDFYKDQVLLGKCFVDTSSYPNRAVFFDGGYQTSFDIALKDWNSVIRK